MSLTQRGPAYSVDQNSRRVLDYWIWRELCSDGALDFSNDFQEASRNKNGVYRLPVNMCKNGGSDFAQFFRSRGLQPKKSGQSRGNTQYTNNVVTLYLGCINLFPIVEKLTKTQHPSGSTPQAWRYCYAVQLELTDDYRVSKILQHPNQFASKLSTSWTWAAQCCLGKGEALTPKNVISEQASLQNAFAERFRLIQGEDIDGSGVGAHLNDVMCQLVRYSAGLPTNDGDAFICFRLSGRDPDSFYLKDLYECEHAEGRAAMPRLSANGAAYLQRAWQLYGKQQIPLGAGNLYSGDASNGVSFFDVNSVVELSDPSKMPLGRFPSPRGRHLNFMQSLALNATTTQLDCENAGARIQAVNGPPGTGKTTLLRDIAASYIVEQAACMADMMARGTAKGHLGEENLQRLARYSVVFASNNNSAVANVIDGLTKIAGVDEEFRNELMELGFPNLANGDAILVAFQGGRKENVYMLLEKVRHMAEELEAERNSAEAERNSAFNDLKALREFQAAWQEAEDLRLALDYYCNGETLGQQQEEVQRRCVEVRNQFANSTEQYNSWNATYAQEMQNAAALCYFDEYARRHGIEYPGWTRFIARFSQRAALRYNAVVNDFNAAVYSHRQQLDWIRNQATAWGQECQRLGDASGSLESAFVSVRQRLVSMQEASQRVNLDPSSITVPDFSQGDYPALHGSTPWLCEAFEHAQRKLFVKAVRLRHRFLKQHVREINNMLDFFDDSYWKSVDWKGSSQKAPDLQKWATSWSMLTLCVPVIGTTFASVRRMIGSGSIGVLAIDEAGQALPESAFGAINRAKKVIVVGDPAQLEPIDKLETPIDGSLRYRFFNDCSCFDGRIEIPSDADATLSESVQTIADQCGTYFSYDGRSGSRRIGIPLCVNHRCGHPVIDISNSLSYHGRMVSPGDARIDAGELAAGQLTRNAHPVPSTTCYAAWFDVSPGMFGGYESGGGAMGSLKNYIPAEGRFVIVAIRELLRDAQITGLMKDDIVVLTPFRNCVEGLRRDLKEADLGDIGVQTVSSYQGQEAPVVFFVLGAGCVNQGAARWAVGKHNLVNVSVTRAKGRLYIVGDHGMYCGAGMPDTCGTVCAVLDGSPSGCVVLRDTVAAFINDVEARRSESGGVAWLRMFGY
ncbi:helicase [Pseudoscardovia radai]|uniref:Helicase n=1 Tax=Pseudoscardovia radai TaxID=987066 RepID=A0A261ER86_9BIFI|nr:ATP-binding protein [Pseudoscardovia radai]OZG49361.1 helicase [Pseudoscardovia radai]